MKPVWACCVIMLSCLLGTAETSAGKNFTLVRLYNLLTKDKNNSLEDVPVRGDFGIKASPMIVNMGEEPDLFKVRRPGFRNMKESVSLESTVFPGHYLRYKNYKFHLQKPQPHAVFAKDATFIEHNPLGSGSIALELSAHSNWFVCHNSHQPYELKAATQEAEDIKFDRECVYVKEKRVSQKEQNGERDMVNGITIKQTDKVKFNKSKAQLGMISSFKLNNGIHPSNINLTKSTTQTKKSSTSSALVNNLQADTRHKNLKENKSKVSGPTYDQHQTFEMTRTGTSTSANHQLQPKLPVQAVVPSGIKPQPASYPRYWGRARTQNPFGQRASLQVSTRAPWVSPQAASLSSYTQHYNNPYSRTQLQQMFLWPESRLRQNIDHEPRTKYFNSYPVQQKIHMSPKPPQYVKQNPSFQAIEPAQSFGRNKQKPFKTIRWQPLTHYSTVTVKRVLTTPVATVKPEESLDFERPRNNLHAQHLAPSIAVKPPLHFSAMTANPAFTTPADLLQQHPSNSGDDEPKIAVPKAGKKRLNAAPLNFLDFNTIQNNIRPDIGDKCIQVRFINEVREAVKIVSSMKPEGYLVTAETFKLKTIFKHPKKNRHVVFYAESLGRDGDEVMLNNNNLISVRPGACNQSYFTVVMSRSKHSSSPEITTHAVIKARTQSSASTTKLGKSPSLNFAAAPKNISSPLSRSLPTNVLNSSVHDNTNVHTASSKTKTITRGEAKDLSSEKHKYFGPKKTFISATKTAPSLTHNKLPAATFIQHLHKHFNRANSSKGRQRHSLQCIASCVKRCKSSCPKVCCRSKMKTNVSLNLT